MSKAMLAKAQYERVMTTGARDAEQRDDIVAAASICPVPIAVL